MIDYLFSSLGSPVTLLILFLAFDILPSIIASIILDLADVEPFLAWSDVDMKTMLLYPLYPVFLPYVKHGYTLLSMATWIVFFFPVFEDVLFFAVPATYGFVYTLVCGIAWAGVHIGRFMAWMWEMAYSPKQLFAGFISQILVYIPSAWLSALLWSAGLGIFSILFHMTHNGFYVLSFIRVLRSPESQVEKPRKYYRIRERRYYKIKSWED